MFRTTSPQALLEPLFPKRHRGHKGKQAHSLLQSPPRSPAPRRTYSRCPSQMERPEDSLLEEVAVSKAWLQPLSPPGKHWEVMQGRPEAGDQSLGPPRHRPGQPCNDSNTCSLGVVGGGLSEVPNDSHILPGHQPQGHRPKHLSSGSRCDSAAAGSALRKCGAEPCARRLRSRRGPPLGGRACAISAKHFLPPPQPECPTSSASGHGPGKVGDTGCSTDRRSSSQLLSPTRGPASSGTRATSRLRCTKSLLKAFIVPQPSAAGI